MAADRGTATGPVSVFNIQRCSIHDGPGIRTTVFLRGCPLRCVWCHNPEGMTTDARDAKDDELWEAADLVAELERDRPFFSASGGGVTFSGGEPLSHPAFLAECIDECRERGLHTAVDTCGFAPTETVRDICERVDVVLYDIKHMDPAVHRSLTGVDNTLILDNLRELSGSTGSEVWIRVPMVPGFNDGLANVDALAAFVEDLPRRHPVFVLPYHAIGFDKWRRLGLEPPAERFRSPCEEELSTAANRLRDHGLEVVIGGADERAS